MRLLLVFILTFFICVDAYSQTNDELGAELDLFIQNQMISQNIPGLSYSMVKDGQVVWKSAFGMANIEDNIPVTLETEFTLASISKLFTATACAQLWEAGDLDIDADINNYLQIDIVNPNFPFIPITVRQLLQHKSSLHDYESDLQLWDAPGDPIYDLETFCSSYFIEGGNLYDSNNWGTSMPGASNYWYSNAGFTLLGYIVEKISDMPFNEYCQTHILDPLEMNTAGWFYSEVDSINLAMPYNNNLVPYGYYSVPEYPAAMIKSNVEELSNFLIAYTQRGWYNGNQILSEPTFQTVVPEDLNNGFGWWGSDTWYGDPTGTYWSHGGYMNGVRTQLNYYPADSTGLIILTNGQGNYSSIQNEIESYIPLFTADVSGIPSKFAISELNIFPNPVEKRQKLNVFFESPFISSIKAEIIDSNGKSLQEYSVQNSTFKVDISSLNSGVYFIRLSADEYSTERKFIIK